MKLTDARYPKPGDQGGRLMRRLISFLKSRGVSLPIDSDILIAVSGGPDSVALAHLLIHFGRRVVNRSKIHLLHVNHHWRSEDSDRDEEFVKNLGDLWNVPVRLRHLSPPTLLKKESWEELAREGRKLIYLEESQQLGGALVLTGHQADDLAETILWRFFTGSLDSHGAGIFFRHESELRPLLSTRKIELLSYLQEVGQSFQVDSTNESDRFLRSRMRKVLMPEVEKLFPKAIEHLVSFALSDRVGQMGMLLQKTEQGSYLRELQKRVFEESGVKMRRNHLKQVIGGKKIQLPDGWILMRESSKKPPNID